MTPAATPSFNQSAAQALAENALQVWGVSYEKRPDGTLFVPQDLDISNRGLAVLPDLSAVVVGRHFLCHQNKLTSLKGAPQQVGGSFSCHENLLTTLEGVPAVIPGNFSCAHNQLTALAQGPRSANDFDCHNNPLTSLEHAPSEVRGAFFCHECKLTSLKGAPLAVGDYFHCYDNRLVSLDDVPRKFTSLRSDFGMYPSWEDVPDFQFSAKVAAEREQARRENATVLQSPLQVGGPLRYKI